MTAVQEQQPPAQGQQPPAAVTAKTVRRAFSPVPLMAVGAIGLLAGALAFLMASAPVSRPSSQVVGAEEAAEAPPPVSPVQAGLTPPWVGRRQAAWDYDGTKTIAFTLDASNDPPLGMARARPQLVARC